MSVCNEASKKKLQPKRILIVTARNPFQVGGGDLVRVKNIIASFDQAEKIVVLCLGRESVDEHISDKLLVVQLKHNFLDVIKSILRFDLTDFSLQCLVYKNRDLFDCVQKYSAESDITVLHLVRMYWYRKAMNSRLLIEVTDMISSNHKDLSLFPRFSIKKLIFKIDSFFFSILERDCVRRYDTVFIAEKDVVSAEGGRQQKSFVIPNPVSFEVTDVFQNGRGLLFIGNLDSEMNFDGLLWFCEKFRAFLMRKELKIFVVGKVSCAKRRQLQRYAGIVSVEGYVEDIHSVASNACLGIAPIFNGAGQQNKILDYISLGLPIASTALAMSAYVGSGIEYEKIDDSSSLEEIIETVSSITYKEKVIKNKIIAENIYGKARVSEMYRSAVNEVFDG